MVDADLSDSGGDSEEQFDEAAFELCFGIGRCSRYAACGQ